MSELPKPVDAARPGALRLRLYVAHGATNSVRALVNLRAVLDPRAELGAELEVIDILSEPGRCFADGVLLTPMLVKVAPPPERRILGNLGDRELLLSTLGIEEPPHG